MDRAARLRSAQRLVAAVLGIALLSACAGSPPSASGDRAGVTVGSTLSAERAAGQPVSGGSLAYGIAAETNSLNPYFGQWAASGYLVANAIYEPLVALTTDGSVKPYLAESMTSDDTFTRWTIRARPGVSFHDGTTFDAAAIVANIEFARKSALVGAILGPIASVTAVDDANVRVDMSTPWSTFPQVFTAQIGYMAAPSMLTGPTPATAQPVGTGPFAFQSRQLDANVVVRKNDRYWQPGKPLLDEIRFKVLPDATARAGAMEAGDIDAMEVTTPEVLADFIQRNDAGRAQLLTNAGQETDEFVIALNTSTAPFDDVLARQALAAAVDQDELSQTVYDGVYPAAWGNFEPGSPFFITREEAGAPAPDVARAKELATQYQQKHGEPLRFTFTVNADSLSSRLGQALQQQLQPLGIEITIVQVDQPKSIANVLGGNFQAGFFLMSSTPTLDRGYLFIATKPAASGISVNYTRFDDPAITKALDASRATKDRGEQLAQYKIVQQQMAKNLDRVFLYHARTAEAFKNRVHGFTAATYPGTDQRAFAPNIASPFYTSMWVEH